MSFYQRHELQESINGSNVGVYLIELMRIQVMGIVEVDQSSRIQVFGHCTFIYTVDDELGEQRVLGMYVNVTRYKKTPIAKMKMFIVCRSSWNRSNAKNERFANCASALSS